MNMTRYMMIEMRVPRVYWLEAVQYAVYILNRCPSAALRDVTPEEKWSNYKPSVEHFRIFGCVGYALMPYEKIIKFDEKSIKCVMFGLIEESKAYRLFNSDTKKIIISRDVQFDESKWWNWEDKEKEKELIWEDIGEVETERMEETDVEPISTQDSDTLEEQPEDKRRRRRKQTNQISNNICMRRNSTQQTSTCLDEGLCPRKCRIYHIRRWI